MREGFLGNIFKGCFQLFRYAIKGMTALCSRCGRIRFEVHGVEFLFEESIEGPC